MDFHGIDEFMWYLKTRYDESERKQEWRALSGRNHVDGSHDTFIFTDSRVYQIKAAEVSRTGKVAVGKELGSSAPDMLELIKGGSPVPLSVISQAMGSPSVVMFGTQQYSSDIADTFRREFFHDRQGDLKTELDRKVDAVVSRPEFRRAYRELREGQDSYFA
jgi:hypothetical protein